jgi:hypothetical protein
MRQLINRRRLFEKVRALVVGGMCPAWVGGLFMREAAAAEQSERLPNFEFLGHRIGDSQEKFSHVFADGSWTNREPDCSSGTSACHGNQKVWSRSGYAVGGIPVDLTYGFENGKLVGAAMAFDSESHRELREMLIGKYGEPFEYGMTVQFHYLLGSGSDPTTFSHWMFREGSLVGAWNFQEASPSQVLGRFNGFLKRSIRSAADTTSLIRASVTAGKSAHGTVSGDPTPTQR